MTLVDPSGDQLLLGLLSGLSHFLSSSLFSSSHTSRGIAEFHVSNFRHDDYFLGFFLGLVPIALSIARPTGLRDLPRFLPNPVPRLRTEGVATASKVPATVPPILPAPLVAEGLGLIAGEDILLTAGEATRAGEAGFFGRLGRRGELARLLAVRVPGLRGPCCFMVETWVGRGLG